MSRPLIVICVEDLKKVVPHFTKEYLDKPEYKKDLFKLLSYFGVDVDYGVEYQEMEAESRTRLCGVTVTDRIVGLEKLDREWLQSGNASYEASVYSKDETVAKDIRKMRMGSKDSIVKVGNKESFDE